MWFTPLLHSWAVVISCLCKYLPNVSSILDPLIFADNTNLFFSHKNIKALFKNLIKNWKKVTELCMPKKLPLNMGNTCHRLLCKNTKNFDLPLFLPKLQVGNNDIIKPNSVKFLCIILEERLNWKSNITIIENKLIKNVCLIYRGRVFLNKKSVINIYHSYISCCLNYANMSCKKVLI